MSFFGSRNRRCLTILAGGLLASCVLLAILTAMRSAYPQSYVTNFSFSPMKASPGGPGFVLTVYGTYVYSYSIVYWNGSPRTTVGFNGTRLSVSIPASDIANPGIADLSVYTEGVGYLGPRQFTIAAPPPCIGNVVPNSVPAGGPGFVLMAINTYNYSNSFSPFTDSSIVTWNESNRVTSFVDAARLQAIVPAEDVASPGMAWVRVTDANGRYSCSMSVTVKEPEPTLNLSINEGGAAHHSTPGTAVLTQSGYATITNAGQIPFGSAVFRYKKNDVTVSEVGVSPSPATYQSRVFIDYRKGVLAVPGRTDSGTVNVNTGIAVVNYGNTVANVTYTLRGLDGNVVALGSGTIDPLKHFAKFIDQLKEVASNFDFPSDFQTSTQFGTLEIRSNQPLSVTAIRGADNQANDFLMTTTPVADLTRVPGNTPIFFPQFVDGGGYTTSLILMNTSNEVESGKLEILRDDGSPMVVTQVGGDSASTVPYTIGPGGSFRFQTDGSPDAAGAGWVRLIPDPSTLTPVGLGLFCYNPEKILVSESGIPASYPTVHARVYVDLSGNHNTGLGLANPNAADQTISIGAYETDGITSIGTSSGPLQLGPDGHAAMFADQLINGLPPDFKGVLDIQSSIPFAAMTIRSVNNERNDFLITSLPVANPSRPMLAPVLFPQIADGGGYATEFIFLSPAGDSDLAVRMFEESGAPMSPEQ